MNTLVFFSWPDLINNHYNKQPVTLWWGVLRENRMILSSPLFLPGDYGMYKLNAQAPYNACKCIRFKCFERSLFGYIGEKNCFSFGIKVVNGRDQP